MTRLGGRWRLLSAAGLLTALVVDSSGPAAALQRAAPPARRGTTAPPPERQGLVRGEHALIHAYEAILDARFDDVGAELARACGPAPREACDTLAATALWWRILHDPMSRELDAAFSSAVNLAIAGTGAWTSRTPADAEAWFYLGAAYAARVQWRVLRGETLAAARDGKKIKDALERALELEPSLEDAYFGIGLYKYYADVAPAAAKFVRFFLMLPGGDRKEGLADMLRARNGGRLLQGEADYQLHIIYLWYERQPVRALALLARLRQQYPGNPLFVAQTAEIQDTYQHDVTASLATWRTLLSLARDERVNLASLADVQARLGAARQLEVLHRTDQAIELLDGIVARQPAAPHGSLAQAYLRLGEAHDRLGARAAAMDAYRKAATTAPADDPVRARERATVLLRRTPNLRTTEAYRLSLEGWRAFEDNDLPAAAAALERSIAINALDPVAHYRYGRVLQARKDDAGALAAFDAAVRHARACPPPILATAYLDSARLHERAGRRDDAIRGYRSAASLFGGADETRAAAARALARLDK